MSLEKILVSIIAALFQSLAATIIIFKQTIVKNNILKIIFFLIIWIHCMLCFYIIPNEYRFLSFLFLSSVVIKFILKVNDRKIILYSFNTEILLSISEIAISFLLVVFGIKSIDIVNNYMYNLLANILISIFSIIMINLTIINRIVKNIINVFDKNKKLMNYLYIILIIVYLVILKNGFEFLMKSNYYINLLFMFFIVFVIMIIIKNVSKYEQLKEINQQMLNYVTKYEKIITEQGKANHEFKNQLMVIRGYAQMNSPKLIEYLDSVVEDANKIYSSYLISQLNKFPDGGIKGLLYYKLSTIEEEKIKYSINVESGIKLRLKSLSVNDYKNITKILGVLFDNAIDASKRSKEKLINIIVTKNNKKIEFKIYNTYKKLIEMEKVGAGYTTKGKGHGYGLRLVEDIINESSILKVNHDLVENYFVSSLIIDISKKSKIRDN